MEEAQLIWRPSITGVTTYSPKGDCVVATESTSYVCLWKASGQRKVNYRYLFFQVSYGAWNTGNFKVVVNDELVEELINYSCWDTTRNYLIDLLNVPDRGILKIDLYASSVQGEENPVFVAPKVMIYTNDGNPNTFWYGETVVTYQLSGLTAGDSTQLEANELPQTYIKRSIITAKGDLIVGEDANLPSSIPVGADGQVLVADSTETLGVKWGYPSPPTAKVVRTTGQSIPNNTNTAVIWNTETWDTDNMVNLATYNTRVTIQTAGKYSFNFHGFFYPNSTGIRRAMIYKNGVYTPSLAFDNHSAASSGSDTVSFSFSDSCSVGDYYEVYVYQTSGAALELTFAAFEVVLISS